MKIKWNRHKKELIELIEDAEKAVADGPYRSESNDDDDQRVICGETGQDQNFC